MPNVFITGANGFLGLNIVEQACKNDYRVTGLVEPGADRKYLDRFSVEVVEGDVCDLNALRAAVPRSADAVIHTAASTSVWSRNNERQTRVNVDGTRILCQACLEAGVKRVVHTSTWNTYGLGHKEISEATPQTGGLSWINYVRSKFLAEEEVRACAARGLSAVILNPCHIIGRYDTRNWARMFGMIRREAVPGIPRTYGSFCNAEAVAQAHLAAIEHGHPGENYLLPGIVATFAEVLSVIAELVGKPKPTREVPMQLVRLVSHLKVAIAALTGREPELTPEGVSLMSNEPRISSTKAQRDLGYRVVPLRIMLEDSYRWLAAEGFLT